MLNRDEDILQAAENWQKAGHGVALATVVETWGSSPRPAGSRLAVSASGKLAGSVSGGCIEGAVKLPLTGDGFRVARPERGRVFGHPSLVALIRELGLRR